MKLPVYNLFIAYVLFALISFPSWLESFKFNIFSSIDLSCDGVWPLCSYKEKDPASFFDTSSHGSLHVVLI